MKKLLFRERDVLEAGASPSCLDDARVFGFAIPHGHGVWSHPDYEPTRYEVLQIRMAKAVFWGPSALWLHRALDKEPDVLWIALGNNFPRPRTVEHGTVIIRSRNVEQDVELIRPLLLELRVHSRERAEADVARNDCAALSARDLRPRHFELDPEGELLSGHVLARRGWAPPSPAPPGYRDEVREDWIVASSISPTAPKPNPRFTRRR